MIQNMYDTSLVQSIRSVAVNNNFTIAVAESVTGGHVQAAISGAVDASLFYQGGLTAYNLGIKCRLLDVDPVEAEKNNCVSRKVAEEMANAVKQMFLSSIGVAVTGYASMQPEKNIFELFAYVCIINKSNQVFHRKFIPQQDEMVNIQVDYTNMVLEFVYGVLKSSG